jgi:hypothetical protein
MLLFKSNANLFGTGCNCKERFGFGALGQRLFGDRRRARHIFITTTTTTTSIPPTLPNKQKSQRHIRRVGAGADEADLELLGPIVVAHRLGKVGNWRGEVGRERAVDVRLQRAQIDVDHLIVLGAAVWRQIRLSIGCLKGDDEGKRN